MERTLSIVKPDGVARGLIGEVVKRLEGNNLKIAAMKMIHMTRPQAEGFYAVHKVAPFLRQPHRIHVFRALRGHGAGGG